MLNLNSDAPVRQVNELPQERLDFVADFFEKTAGCLADDPIERAPQGDYEIRKRLK